MRYVVWGFECVIYKIGESFTGQHSVVIWGFASSFLLLCITNCFECMQAILPLRGKILNIERKDEAAMYKNEEIQNLILGLGLGVKVIYPPICSFLSLSAILANAM